MVPDSSLLNLLSDEAISKHLSPIMKRAIRLAQSIVSATGCDPIAALALAAQHEISQLVERDADPG